MSAKSQQLAVRRASTLLASVLLGFSRCTGCTTMLDSRAHETQARERDSLLKLDVNFRWISAAEVDAS
eukprot:14982897-Alexandrium_andersonii.AAC.1